MSIWVYTSLFSGEFRYFDVSNYKSFSGNLVNYFLILMVRVVILAAWCGYSCDSMACEWKEDAIFKRNRYLTSKFFFSFSLSKRFNHILILGYVWWFSLKYFTLWCHLCPLTLHSVYITLYNFYRFRQHIGIQ